MAIVLELFTSLETDGDDEALATFAQRVLESALNNQITAPGLGIAAAPSRNPGIYSGEHHGPAGPAVSHPRNEEAMWPSDAGAASPSVDFSPPPDIIEPSGINPRINTFSISLLLTNDDAMRQINLEHRAIETTTDVLSFPQYEDLSAAPIPPAGESIPLGDIVISLQRVTAQAREYGHSWDREFGFLLVHGLLHLLGYDHQTEPDGERMEALQEACLSKLGLTR